MRNFLSNAAALTLIAGFFASTPGGFAQSPGTIQAWGFNATGDLGDGSTVHRTTPIGVPGLAEITSIAAGAGHSLALLSNGSVRAWGWNVAGQLGIGTNVDSHVPVPVYNLGGVVSITAGGAHSLALLWDGTIRAWGDNQFGQLGNGANSNSPIPVAVIGLGFAPPGAKGVPPGPVARVVAVAGGRHHSLALLSDGTVRAWGYNGYGQLGNGTTTNSNIPVAVSGLGGVVAIAAGAYHNLAVRSDGTVWTWGGNFRGEGGSVGLNAINPTPVQIPGIAGATTVSAGTYSSTALLSDHTVRAWGSNSAGQLGNGSRVDSPAPVPVSGLSNVTAIASGLALAHSLALLADGTVQAWGLSDDGELGVGANGYITTPTPVLNLAGVIRIAAGSHDLAIVNPLMTVDPPVGFGEIGLSSTSTGVVTITNRGPGPATITHLDTNGPNAEDFSITDPGLPYSIPEGLSAMVNVTFRPSSVGVRSATMRITDNAFQSPHTVTLRGEGGPTADVAVSLTATADTVSRTITYTAVVTNTGPTETTGADFRFARSGPLFGDPASITTSQGSCGVGFSGARRCFLGDLAAGARATVRFTVPVLATVPTDIIYSVSAFADAGDPTLANNTATVVTHWLSLK